MRLRWLAVIVVLFGGAACGHPWWYQAGESSCGYAYMLRIHGHVGSYGGCTGGLVEPPPVLRVHVGEHFDLHVDDPPPSLSTPGVLSRTAQAYDADRGESTLGFEAIKAGSTSLLYEHTYCTILRTHRQRTGVCALLRIVVAAS